MCAPVARFQSTATIVAGAVGKQRGVTPHETPFGALTAAVLLFVLVSVISGCALRRSPTLASKLPPVRRSAQELLALLQRRANAVQDLRGVAQLSLKLPGSRFKAKQAILIKLPAMVRFETLGLFGQSVFLFSSDSRQLRIFYPKERKFYIAKATAENLHRLLGMQLSLTGLATLAGGAVPLQAPLHHLTVSYQAAEQSEVLSFDLPDSGRQYVWFTAGSAEPNRVIVYDKEGRLKVLAAFTRYRAPSSHRDNDQPFSRQLEPARNVALGRFPHTIEIVMPQDGAVLRLRYEELEFNVGLEQAAFAFAAPSGVEVINLDEAS